MSEYSIFKDGMQIGPYSLEELKKMLFNKTVTESTVVKVSGGRNDGRYLPIKEIIGDSTLQNLKPAVFLSIKDGMTRIACPFCGQHYRTTDTPFSSDTYICSKCDQKFSFPKIDNTYAEDMSNEIPDGDLLCPHCWKSFDADYILYISVHPSLFGDPVLGDYAPKRFTPTVFNQMGQPLDEKGLPAIEMACPRCHLRLPPGLMDKPSLYFSIAGAPSSGKSYFLTCQTHQLRKSLPEYFGTAFFDAVPKMNETLNSYEKRLFMSLTPNEITTLPATQIAGEGISDRIRLNDIDIELPKPFVFDFRQKNGQNDINMIFYDNSGEMFLPGRDEWVNQATFHLSHSNGIVYLFDPTNDAGMRLNFCDERDPQVSKNPRVEDQTLLLNEIISRIRLHSNMLSAETCKIPLVIAVGKYDLWKENCPIDVSKIPYITKQKGCSNEDENVLATETIARVSYAIRDIMLKYMSEFINTAESFFETVYFVPVSNFGTIAEQNADGAIGVVPSKIKPVWVDVPALLLLALDGEIPMEKRAVSTADKLGTISKNMIVFTHPADGRIIHLPLCYAGLEIEINGKKYKLPADPKSFH